MSTKHLKETLKSELINELSNILAYWQENTIDKKNGGFIGQVDFENVPDALAPKGAVLNARILWTFSAAYRQTKKEAYLLMATRAYQYIMDYFIDNEFGGVFWELNADGSIRNGRKQIYALSFTIYGLCEFYSISGNPKAIETSIELFKLIEKYSFDTSKNGYVEALSREWGKLADLRLSDKDANESKTMNTHLHILEAYTNLYRSLKSEQLKTALTNLIELFLNKFINKQGNLNLFFDDDWNLKSSEISYGHDIECSWLLCEAAEVLGDDKLINRVKDIAIKMAELTKKGLDSDGGIFNNYLPEKDKMDTDKHWWPQAEAVVGFYNAYQISNNPVFLQDSINSWSFIKEFILDKENGEWFWRVNKQGTPYITDEKAGFWKCPYHNSRACIEIVNRIK